MPSKQEHPTGQTKKTKGQSVAMKSTKKSKADEILAKGKRIEPRPDEKGPLSRPLTPPEQEAIKRAPKTRPYNLKADAANY